jgi:hypothetical protein
MTGLYRSTVLVQGFLNVQQSLAAEICNSQSEGVKAMPPLQIWVCIQGKAVGIALPVLLSPNRL